MSDLIVRIAAGDRDAFDTLTEKYTSQLRGYFYRRTHSTETAEDLAQECLLKIFRFAMHYRDMGQEKLWILRLARNVFIDHMRKRNAAKSIRCAVAAYNDDGEPIYSGLPSPDREPVDIAISKEEAAAIEEQLERIPPTQAFVIRRFRDGDSLPEIAEDLDECLPTIKSRLRIGREKVVSGLGRRSAG